MRFKDIPQFALGHYNVDVPMDSIIGYIGRYQKEYGLDMEPDFQRGHVWSTDQQSRFVEFLLRGGQSNRTLYFNCPGWMDSFEKHMVLVDGLQRLTACIGFMQDKVLVFGHKFSEFEGHMSAMTGLRFNVNSLKTRAEVLQWYIDLNDGGVVHSSTEIDRVRKLLEAEKGQS